MGGWVTGDLIKIKTYRFLARADLALARSHTFKYCVFHQYPISTMIAYSFSMISVSNKAKMGNKDYKNNQGEKGVEY